jgi:hypothetical protein
MTVPFDHVQPENTLPAAMAKLRNDGILKKGNMAVVIGAVSSDNQIVDVVQMRRVE